MNISKLDALYSASALVLSFVAVSASAQTATAPQATPPASVDASIPATEPQSTPPVATKGDDNQLQDIVVTAQRREQSLQDVPIAITAITSQALEANRITSVQDLTGLAPNLTVRPSSGGIALPTFTLRGVTSYGVVPGSDKEISIYVDGVYIASPRGSAFELPDIERIEVLRGPQGTLFGRNATAGAISITTREPTGVFGARQDFTYGNYNQLRWRTTVDTPAFGPFSAYFTYVHDQRDGDIKNLGAETVWNRTGPGTNTQVEQSPRTLGSKDADEFFAALRFEPSSNFNMTYKFDYTFNVFSPPGMAFVAYVPTAPLVGNLVTTTINSQPNAVLVDSSATRPDAVNDSFAINSRQRSYGHTLIANYRLSDQLSFKNIAAYRHGFINSAMNLDGLGGLTFTPQMLVPYATFAAFSRNPALATASPAVQGATIQATAAALAPLIGSRFCFVCNNSQTTSEQYSEELQANFSSKLIDITAGAIYLHQDDNSGGPPHIANNFQFTPLAASGLLALGNEATVYSKATSVAGYAQGELHVVPHLDLVGGVRVTNDDKAGTFVRGGTFVPGPNGRSDGTYVNQTFSSYTYNKTKATYSGGANFKPTSDLLFYAKYSTAFVSGGSVADVPFQPETVGAVEVGAKADLFDRRLRTNIALFNAHYEHLQSAQSGTNFGRPDLSTLIIDYGNRTARGVEFEGTVIPFRGATVGGSVGYTHIHDSNQSPLIFAAYGNATRLVPIGIPSWTGALYAQYSMPVSRGANLIFRADSTYRSRRRNDPNPDRATTTPSFAALDSTPAYWLVNGRVSLENITIGRSSFEIAGWVKNLTQRREANFPLQLGSLEATDFIPARTYGIDLSVRFR